MTATRPRSAAGVITAPDATRWLRQPRRRPSSSATSWSTGCSWLIFVCGFFEPVFYLFSLGVGLGKLGRVGDVARADVSYAAFVAPAMLAAPR